MRANLQNTRDGRRDGRGRWKVRVLRSFGLVLVVVLILAVVMWSFQRRLMYPGTWMQFPEVTTTSADVERWTHELPDHPGQSVEAWLIPGAGATAKRPGPAVVFLHGNGEVIELWATELRPYVERGVTVLLPEYRGYGRSGGTPSQRRIGEDLEHWVARLTELEYVDGDRLIYHGRSLGGGFAAQLTRHRPPAALVLSASFTSMADAARDLMGVPRFLIRDRLPVAEVLADYPGPVLVLHGDHDTVVGPHHARANAAAAADSTLKIYPGAGHNSMPQGNGAWADIFDFLERHGLLAEETER
jgi:fermentation-respiration switch protein FrsA (DUF1100 family)